jgi:hypothetical protein
MGREAFVIERREVIEDRQRGNAHSGMLARRATKWVVVNGTCSNAQLLVGIRQWAPRGPSALSKVTRTPPAA